MFYQTEAKYPMTLQNTNRRLTPNNISADAEAFAGLKTIGNYNTNRPEASLEAAQKAYDTMLIKQKDEIEKQIMLKSAAAAARLAEWELHNAMLAVKEVVKGQFGSDSDEAQALGLKKKSERKRPSRKKTEL